MDPKASVIEKKIEELEEEESKTKDNKKTNKHIRILRAKIAKAKRELVVASKRVAGHGFFVKKTGDATVALVGFPNAGKSSLINIIANTRSKTANYAFTTTTVVPGTMIYNDAHIQVFDLPGIIEGAHLGAGGGLTIISAMKTADLLLFVIDINRLDEFDKLMGELKALNVHINKKAPSYQINETQSGGLKIEVNRSGMSDDDLREILIGLGVHNGSASVWDKVGEDEFIMLMSGKCRYINAIVALNKIDTVAGYERIAKEFAASHGIRTVPISAANSSNIESLRKAIFEALGIITVYLKPKFGEDDSKPMVLKGGATVGMAAQKLHTEIVDALKCAYVTGPSARFANQKVGIDHVLQSGDTITFIRNK